MTWTTDPTDAIALRGIPAVGPGCAGGAIRGTRPGYNGREGTKLYRESYAPNCWLARDPENPPTFRLGHDGRVIGHIASVIAHKTWHYASAVIDQPLDEHERAQITRGAKVSLGAHSLRCDDDPDLRLARHTVCRLDEIALLRRGAVPGFIGAVITDVHELPDAKPAVQIVDGIELEPGDELYDLERGLITRNNGGWLERRPHNGHELLTRYFETTITVR